MAAGSQCCSVAQLEFALRCELTAAEQLVLDEHLEQCDACRRKLDDLAAAGDVWGIARRSLAVGSSGAPGSTPGTLAELEISDDHRPPPGESFADAGDREGTPAVADISVTADAPIYFLKSFLGPTDDPAMIGRIGPYEVVGMIGQGGMGIVLKALDRSLNRFVAIKVMQPTCAGTETARARFAREARAAAAISHLHVVAIHAVAEWNGLPYLVMPYIRGESLQRRLDVQGRFSVEEILRVGVQIASGLAAAHAQGLVHRDIKPANILMEQGVERLQITDFGLARADDDASQTLSGVIAGTPRFMSPEQARGERVDTRSDLFSLGSVLYTLATGHSPFRAETTFAVLRRITEDTPRSIREMNPEIPGWLERLIHRLLVKDPDLRFQTAAEVAHVCERCLRYRQHPEMTPLPLELAEDPAQTGHRPRFGWIRLKRRYRWLTVSLIGSLVVIPAITLAWRGSTPESSASSSALL
ncbi:MAG: serine/threonine protein kinase, partial [Planctomycetaceae bacterium]|nr:serine/threonine protein kinase [Planctomycetaceae bacterium]